jgi:hypothetical protein
MATTPLGTFMAGAYTATWNTNSIGLVDEGGFRIGDTPIKEVIKASLYGENVIDKIYQGRKVTVLCTLIEWTANIRTLLNPYNAALGNPGVHGTLDTAYANPLVLTALAGTPAAGTSGPATITFHSAVISDENNIEFALNSGLRKIPILFDVYYTNVSGTLKYYTIT